MTISIFLSNENFSIAGKSVADISIFSPNNAVPGLPGAIYNFWQSGLNDICLANAFSLPPEPKSKIFMFKCFDKSKAMYEYSEIMSVNFNLVSNLTEIIQQSFRFTTYYSVIDIKNKNLDVRYICERNSQVIW